MSDQLSHQHTTFTIDNQTNILINCIECSLEIFNNEIRKCIEYRTKQQDKNNNTNEKKKIQIKDGSIN